VSGVGYLSLAVWYDDRNFSGILLLVSVYSIRLS
jgi:hypothetical protein